MRKTEEPDASYILSLIHIYETPVVEEVTGRPEIAFEGAAAEQVTFSYGAKGGEQGNGGNQQPLKAHGTV